MATQDDLAETTKQVEELDRRIVAAQADVRDRAALQAAFDQGVAALGGVDIVLGNAGIAPMSAAADPVQAFRDVILEPVEISNAILWLVSDEARYVTGVTLPVDAGFLVK